MTRLWSIKGEHTHIHIHTHIPKHIYVSEEILLSLSQFWPYFQLINLKKTKKRHFILKWHQFSSVIQLCPTFVTSWTAAHQAFLSFTDSQNLLKLRPIESVMPSKHLIHYLPHLLLFSQHQGLFHWVNLSHQVAKKLDLQLQHQSFQWIFRTDFL